MQCNSLISIYFSKIAGATIGSLKFWEAKRNQWFEHCAAIEVTDSGVNKGVRWA
jgi:hypothetical protein